MNAKERLETARYFNEYYIELANKDSKRKDMVFESRKEKNNYINSILESRDIAIKSNIDTKNKIRDEAYAEAVKAIYIGAVNEVMSLSEDGIRLASNIVDNWVKESGGADSIIRKCGDKTYIHHILHKVTEDAEEEKSESDKKEEEDDEKKDTSIQFKDNTDDEKSEDSDKDKDAEDKKSESDDDGDENDKSDDDEEDEDKNSSIVIRTLSKDDDVKKALETIRDRIADAEEKFIKRNAEDKKKIDDLLNKISSNVKTVENISDNDSAKANIANENARRYRAEMNDMIEHKSQTILEAMTNTLMSNIIKNKAINENFVTESGIDIEHVFETSMVMYGFLETVNTLQLEKVDSKYIDKVIKNMK